MKTMKILMLLQDKYELDAVDMYSTVMPIILQIPQEKASIVSHIEKILSYIQIVYKEMLDVYTSGIHAETYIRKCLNDNCRYYTQVERSTEIAKWINTVGVNNILKIQTPPVTKASNARMVDILMQLYDLKIVESMPCVLDSIINVIIVKEY